jgi:hypothetical protein
MTKMSGMSENEKANGADLDKLSPREISFLLRLVESAASDDDSVWELERANIQRKLKRFDSLNVYMGMAAVLGPPTSYSECKVHIPGDEVATITVHCPGSDSKLRSDMLNGAEEALRKAMGMDSISPQPGQMTPYKLNVVMSTYSALREKARQLQTALDNNKSEHVQHIISPELNKTKQAMREMEQEPIFLRKMLPLV